jgi:hypothetical protein
MPTWTAQNPQGCGNWIHTEGSCTVSTGFIQAAVLWNQPQCYMLAGVMCEIFYPIIPGSSE